MFSAIHRWPSSSLWSRPFSISAMVLRRRRAALRGAVSAALVRLSCTASLSARAGGPEERLSPSCRRCSPSGLIPRGVAATPAHGRKASARHPTVHEVGCALRRHPRARASRQPPPPRFSFSPVCLRAYGAQRLQAATQRREGRVSCGPRSRCTTCSTPALHYSSRVP
jgi:hypothetical protein